MISWETYFERTVEIHLDFVAARQALGAFTASPDAVNAFAQEEVEKMRTCVSGAEGADKVKNLAQRLEEYLQFSVERIPKQMKGVEKRLLQHELVLRVAAYESFMRDIHRRVLREEPTLLRADRKVEFGKVLSVGLDVVVQEEIEREVLAVERKGARDKAEYFLQRLRIDWSFNSTVFPLLETLVHTRNVILHEDPDYEVSEDLVGVTAAVLSSIPWLTVVQAALLYPDGFVLPQHVSRERALDILKDCKPPPPAASLPLTTTGDAEGA